MYNIYARFDRLKSPPYSSHIESLHATHDNTYIDHRCLCALYRVGCAMDRMHAITTLLSAKRFLVAARTAQWRPQR
jgi:hypothetical protein